MLVSTSQGTITALENLKRGAYPWTVKRLCAALDVKPADLMLRADNTRNLQRRRSRRADGALRVHFKTAS